MKPDIAKKTEDLPVDTAHQLNVRRARLRSEPVFFLRTKQGITLDVGTDLRAVYVSYETEKKRGSVGLQILKQHVGQLTPVNLQVHPTSRFR